MDRGAWWGIVHGVTKSRTYSRGEQSPLLPLEQRPDYLGESGMGSRVFYWIFEREIILQSSRQWLLNKLEN